LLEWAPRAAVRRVCRAPHALALVRRLEQAPHQLVRELEGSRHAVVGAVDLLVLVPRGFRKLHQVPPGVGEVSRRSLSVPASEDQTSTRPRVNSENAVKTLGERRNCDC
jgi:hypothetical protein